MRLKVFLIFVGFGFHSARRAKAALASQGFLLILLLFVFSAVWKAAAVGGLGGEFESSRYLWYVLLTEIVAVGTPLVHRTIQESIASGEFHSRLVSPSSHLLEIYGRSLGEAILRFTYLSTIGVLTALAFTGSGPVNYLGFGSALLLLPLAMAALMIIYMGIGLVAAWIGDVLPVYWVIQKTLFIFGGLLTPLTLYPNLLREVALWTPFSAILYGTAHHVFEFNLITWLQSLTVLIAWTLLLAAILYFAASKVNGYLLSGGRSA